MARKIVFIPYNHFDPTWRRCFDREAIYNGVTVQPYAKLEALAFEVWLSGADRGYSFSEGQAAIWRKYLERYPTQLAKLRQLSDTNQLCVMMAGETVQDTNLPTAEGLIRNFLVALPLYHELCGLNHPGLKVVWLHDAFGQTPNYPQIIRGVGGEFAARLTYQECPGEVWAGIDGTKVMVPDHMPLAGGVGSVEKHPPCSECCGTGKIVSSGDTCQACAGIGMKLAPPVDLDQVRIQARRIAMEGRGGPSITRGAGEYVAGIGGDNDSDLSGALEPTAPEHDMAFVILGGEELLPARDLPGLIDELREEFPDIEFRCGTFVDFHEHHRKQLEKSLSTADGSRALDLNPAMPGCYVSRIRNKQRVRSISYKLIAAEARLATQSWNAGSPPKYPEILTKAWRAVTFNQFHDAITGTHIDSANVELMDMLDAAEQAADQMLPPVETPPAGTFTDLPAGESEKRLGRWNVRFDQKGILSIEGQAGADLFGCLRHGRLRRPFRIAELALEADFGDAWGQRIEPLVNPVRAISQVQLGDYHTGVKASHDAIQWSGVYSGGDPMVKALAWTVTCKSSPAGDRLDFETIVIWDTHSRRIRVIIPVNSQKSSATYETQFGFVDRDYDGSKLDYTQWHGNAMEFPALHWVRQAIDDSSGVALLNRGIPCYRWRPGSLDISLLRSPEWQFCSVEPMYYEFWDIDGFRDTGTHKFEYSLYPYEDRVSEHDLTVAGYAYNLPLPIDPPFHISGNVVMTAWKPAEDGDGWILRLQETLGKPSPVSITFAEPTVVTVTDLLERQLESSVISSNFTYSLHKHGLLTLRIQRQK